MIDDVRGCVNEHRRGLHRHRHRHKHHPYGTHWLALGNPCRISGCSLLSIINIVAIKSSGRLSRYMLPHVSLSYFTSRLFVSKSDVSERSNPLLEYVCPQGNQIRVGADIQSDCDTLRSPRMRAFFRWSFLWYSGTSSDSYVSVMLYYSFSPCRTYPG